MKATLTPIQARLSEGISVQQCKTLIIYMRKKWKDWSDGRKFLRPKTIFGQTNFYNYLEECDLKKYENRSS